MKRYGVIRCRLKRSVRMGTALRTLGEIMSAERCEYSECLLSGRAIINEHKILGRLPFERGGNAVKRIVEKHPTLAPLERTQKEKSGNATAEYSVFSSYGEGYELIDNVDYSVVLAVADDMAVKKYRPNELGIILNKISFPSTADAPLGIRKSTDDFDMPIGNYIMLRWTKRGFQRHLDAYFSSDEHNYFDMYVVAFKLAKKLGEIDEIRFNK